MSGPGETIDLTNCEREPIHIPGSIQPHGVLLGALEPALTIVQASTNAGALLGIEHDALVGMQLAEVLDTSALGAFEQARARESFHQASALEVSVRGRVFDAILHRSEGLLVVELEPRVVLPGDIGSMREFYERAHQALVRLQDVRRLAELWPELCRVVREITGFDRIMIYRFDERDGSGEVIAEEKIAGIEPYLGLHYPASDIPPQARRLYVLNRLRLIRDARYVPVPIVPADNPLTGRPLDLGQSVLRSVSPIHCEYLQNMGVAASMSISLVKDEQLWGLIACHHYTPRQVPYRVRMLCAFLGDLVSWMLGPRLEIEENDVRLRAGVIQVRLVERMSTEADPVAVLTSGSPSALDLIEARGFAVSFEGRIDTAGLTPSVAEIAGITEWLQASETSCAYVTDALPAVYPPARAFKEAASGLLATAVSHARGMYLLWFRPEVIQEVRWGGNPHKPVDASGERLGPRKSFALWRETVRERSLPWADWEVEAAAELRSVTAGVVLQKAAEIFHLNLDLRRAVQSRDDFLSMAAHELKTPVATLRLQIEGMRRQCVRGRDEPSRLLPRLDTAERQTERLEMVINRLLDVSRIASGHLELEREPFDLGELGREVIDRYSGVGVAIHLDTSGDLEGVWDRFRLDQVLTNLLSNALKYGGRKPVEVILDGTGARVRATVRDRGIGISPEALERIFDRFERAVSPSNFAGFGLGLWIVRQIIERHGGRIDVVSAPGEGSTFTFELPRHPEPGEEGLS